jgi:hypothetical protein
LKSAPWQVDEEANRLSAASNARGAWLSGSSDSGVSGLCGCWALERGRRSVRDRWLDGVGDDGEEVVRRGMEG